MQPDPFALVDLATALPNAARLPMDTLGSDSLARLEGLGLGLDLGLDLGLPGLETCGRAATRLGILYPSRGHRLDVFAGASEVLGDAAALHSAILLTPISGPPRVVTDSWSRTDLLSLHRTAARHAWKSSHLLRRAARVLACEARYETRGGAGETSGTRLPAAGAAPKSGVGPRGDGPTEAAAARRPSDPTAARMLGFLPRLTGRLLAQARRKHLTRRAWFLAFHLDPGGPIPQDLSDFRRLTPPRDRFWADPFPVVTASVCHIFVEEWPYGLGRGRIAVLEMDRAGQWRRLGTALERPYHLSYPFVFRWKDETYMLPEGSAGGAVELYRAAAYPLEWEPVAVLLEDEDAVDATLVEWQEWWWMFVNRGDEGVSRCDELHLFRAASPLGPWHPHPANPVISDVRAARPAGRLIRSGDELYRPAQDCSRRYGHAVEVRRVVELSMETYREEPYCRLDPRHLDGANRTHTLNTDGWLTVVDGHRDRWRLP